MPVVGLVAMLHAAVPPAAPSSNKACEDASPDCRYWAHSQNECTTNSIWMDLHCPSACGACLGPCADADPSCTAWAAAGECDANSRYMIERCPASCDLCPKLDDDALQCDGCLALQEAIWRALQPLHASDGLERPSAAMGALIPRDSVRRAVADACVSHEWVSLGMSYAYHAYCESTL